MKILAVTVLFNPDPELLLRSVASYAGCVRKVLAWRNSPLPPELEEALLGFGNVELRGDGTNAGIPRALNSALREAAACGCDTLLTMDQDSVWHGFGSFLAAVSAPGAPEGFYSPETRTGDAGASAHADEAAGGSTHADRAPGVSAGDGEAAGTSAHADEAAGASAGDGEAAGEAFHATDTAYTSGMLVPVCIAERIGGWDEDFTVDGVDNEFCLHALSLGIRCWKVGAGWLEHRLGKVEFRRLLGLRFRVYNYPPERLYGIYRNNLVAIRRYSSVSGPFRKLFLHTWGWRRPVRMLLGEKQLAAKLRAILRGLRDSRTGKGC